MNSLNIFLVFNSVKSLFKTCDESVSKARLLSMKMVHIFNYIIYMTCIQYYKKYTYIDNIL